MARAMAGLSFFAGGLIRRFGVVPILTAGLALNLACVGINLSGQTLNQFWVALFLLGVGWNFLFIGGTTLMTETYRPEEGTKVQALNDFIVFGLVTVATFSSGVLQNTLGWRAINLAVLAPLGLCLLAVVWLQTPARGPPLIPADGARGGRTRSIPRLNLNEWARESRTPGTSFEGESWTDSRQGSPGPPSNRRPAAVALLSRRVGLGCRRREPYP